MYEKENTKSNDVINPRDAQGDAGEQLGGFEASDSATVEAGFGLSGDDSSQDTADSLETVEDSSEDSSGIHDSTDWESGIGNDDISAGDGEQTSEPVTDGDIGDADRSQGDSGGGDTVYNYYMECTDYTDALLSLQASFDTLNETLFLILVFLLLSWTEKKISLAVRKFTVERRK